MEIINDKDYSMGKCHKCCKFSGRQECPVCAKKFCAICQKGHQCDKPNDIFNVFGDIFGGGKRG